IRAQLVEQLKCLDQQCELRVQLLQDLQDFFRRKAEEGAECAVSSQLLEPVVDSGEEGEPRPRYPL
ncbi:unnamed protein product, partial [Coregonus sp. 'balchen']